MNREPESCCVYIPAETCERDRELREGKRGREGRKQGKERRDSRMTRSKNPKTCLSLSPFLHFSLYCHYFPMETERERERNGIDIKIVMREAARLFQHIFHTYIQLLLLYIHYNFHHHHHHHDITFCVSPSLSLL